MASSHVRLTGGASSQWVGFNPLVEPEPSGSHSQLPFSLSPLCPSLTRSRDRTGDRGRPHRRRSIPAGFGRYCRHADAQKLHHLAL